MSEKKPSVPRSFWVIGGAALVWNLIGVMTYVMQVTMTEEALMALPEAERAIYQNMPAWATSAQAIAVTAGVLGCILLLLRSSWAVPVFLLSLAGVLMQMYHAFVIANAFEVLGPSSAVLPALVIGIAAALIWYARVAKEQRWIS